MRSTRILRFEILFPIALLAFCGAAVTYVSSIFSTSTRWVVLLLLVFVVLAKGRLSFVLRGNVGVSLLAYLLWCSATVLWSQVPLLTSLKVMALWMVVVGFVTAGQMWVRWTGAVGAIWYALPLVAVALFAGLVGTVTPNTRVQTGGLELYSGLTGNPNMLGSLMDMALPFLLVQMYVSRPRHRWWFCWAIMLCVVVLFLLMSTSRSAIVTALVTGLSFIVASRSLRRSHVIYLVGVTMLLCIVFISGVSKQILDRYLYKGSRDTDYGVFHSRAEPWTISYESAKDGGVIGAGYGVSVGYMEFQGGLTAVGYGREKGNSQLAIIEETGVVGLALYVAYLIAMFKRIQLAMRRCRSRHDRVLLATLTGSLVGYFLKSLVEAWWVAPGSPEAAYFWATAGVTLGICASLDTKSRSHGR